jgi:hypothetical protein
VKSDENGCGAQPKAFFFKHIARLPNRAHVGPKRLPSQTDCQRVRLCWAAHCRKSLHLSSTNLRAQTSVALRVADTRYGWDSEGGVRTPAAGP